MQVNTIDYDGFAAHLTYHDRRSTTIRKHINCLKYLERHQIALTSKDIQALFIKLKSESKSNAYLNMFVNALHLYAEFTQNEDLKTLKRFIRRPSIKATLSDSEIEAFLGLTRRKNQPTWHYKLFTMFWEIVAFTGCRPGEVAKLKKQNIDWGRGVIVIETSKTNQPGQVPIPVNITDHLKEYLKELSTDYLFPSHNGGTHYSMSELPVVDNVDWHHDWKRRLQTLGLTRDHLTPYSFRHSYATRLLEEEVSLFHVKKLMRHNDLKSTLVYEHLTTKDLIKAQQKLPLIRKATQPSQVLQNLVSLIKGFRIEEDKRFTYQLVENENSIMFECSIVDV